MVGKIIDKSAQDAIVQAIHEAESGTSGEIRVHVQKGLAKNIMEEARKVFRSNKMHLTRQRNGVLIFISWKSREFAVFGDEGIYRAAGDFFWNETCHKMKQHFLKNEIKEGIVEAVQFVGGKLKQYFPAESKNENELSNEVTES